MSINKFITNLDLARQAEIMSGETAVFQGGIELGIPFSGFPSGVDTSTIVSLGIVNSEFAAFSGNTGTTVFNVTDPSSPYYSVSATTLSASPYTIIDGGSITETVSATTYPTIMTFTALSGDCCSTPISVSFTPPIIQELYDRGLYDGLFNGLGQASIGTTYIDESFYNVGSVFSGANLNMEIVEYGVHGTTPAWVTGTTSGTVIEYSALTQYWTDPIYESLTSGLTLPITPESADTQTSNYVWTLTDSTIIDENFVGLQYTGYSVTYSFDNVIIDPESPSITGGVTGATSADTYYLGTVTATLENFSAGTLDYKGTTNWLIVNGSATIDERLTTDRMTIHTLGTGSPVTMLAVDVNGNVVGGTGGTTDDTGAFTSTTANNTIIPTNAAGNTNESNFASILAGVSNTISGSSLSYGASITAGLSNEINGFSTTSIIAGGQDNTISTSRGSIIGSKDSTINSLLFSFIGGGDTNTIDTSDYSAIVGGSGNTINGFDRSAILGGQGITASADDTLYFPNFESIVSNALFYSDYGAGGGPSVRLSAATSDLPRIGVTTPGAQGVTFGIRGSSESSFPGYGKQGDVWFYGTDTTNGINIINTVGAGKENYIRFFAGQDADGTTPDIFIKGSGSTRGNVGIGTETPTEKLDVNGNVILSGTLNIGTLGGGASVNNLGIDASGNVVAGTAGGGLTIDPYNDLGNVNTTQTWDVSGTSTNYELTLTGSITLNLNNVRNGDYGTIIVEQDGVGSHTLTFGTINGAAGTHKVVNGGGGSPTLTSTPNAIDILSFTYNGTTMYWTVGNDYT